MKQRARFGLSARARLHPKQDGEPWLIELRCGGVKFLMDVGEGRLLADELDDAIAKAESLDSPKQPENHA